MFKDNIAFIHAEVTRNNTAPSLQKKEYRRGMAAQAFVVALPFGDYQVSFFKAFTERA